MRRRPTEPCAATAARAQVTRASSDNAIIRQLTLSDMTRPSLTHRLGYTAAKRRGDQTGSIAGDAATDQSDDGDGGCAAHDRHQPLTVVGSLPQLTNAIKLDVSGPCSAPG